MGRTGDRKSQEEMLAASADGLRLLIEELPAVTWLSLLEPSRSTIYISPQIETLTGYQARDWFDDPDFTLRVTHPVDRDRMIEANAKHVSEGRPISERYRIATRDGDVVWVREESRIIGHDGAGPVASQGILLDITDEKAQERELEENVALRHDLATRMVRGQEAEWVRVAAEIRDSGVGVLSEVSARLEAITRSLTDEQQGMDVMDVAEMVEGVAKRLGRLAFDLYPAVEEKGFARAIESLLRDIAEPGGIATHLDDRLRQEPSADARIVAYRIVKEALINVRQHAQTPGVVIAIVPFKSGLLVTIEDSGEGFDPGSAVESPAGHLGLKLMRERAEMAGGWLRVDSAIGRGTTIEFWLPSST